MFRLKVSTTKNQGKLQGLINCIRSLSAGSGLDQLISRASWNRQTISQPEKMQPSKRRKRCFCWVKLWKNISSLHLVPFQVGTTATAFYLRWHHCLWRCWSSLILVLVLFCPQLVDACITNFSPQTRQFFGRREITLCTHPHNSSNSCNKYLFFSKPILFLISNSVSSLWFRLRLIAKFIISMKIKEILTEEV